MKHEIKMNVIGNSYKSYVVSIISSHKEIKEGFTFNGVSLKQSKKDTYYIASTKTLMVCKDSDCLCVIPKDDMGNLEGLVAMFNECNGGFVLETEVEKFVREHRIKNDSNFVKFANECKAEFLDDFLDKAVEAKTELAAKAIKTLFRYYKPEISTKAAFIALAEARAWDGLKSLGNPFYLN